MRRYLPILDWSKDYSRDQFGADLLAAVIVTLMLIPQSLAYALLAGLPAEVGLYASIAPLLLYTVFGTSRTLAVGPVAVASLMTAAAIAPLAAEGTAEYLGAAVLLAFVSGVFLLAMGLLRLGFIANFLSHPVISGFISASGLLIAAGQLGHLFGISVRGEALPALLQNAWAALGQINPYTMALGLPALAALFAARRYLKPALMTLGLAERPATLLVRAAPVGVVIVTIALAYVFGLEGKGVALVGEVPRGLPMPTLPPLDPALWAQILLPAALISIVGYVETISVAQSLAARRRQRIDPDQELVALGASNIGSALSGGFPVTGGFARSVVNFDAGAQTPAAGAYTAVAMALATLTLTPMLYFLPKATLAATIIVAVLSLVDLGALRRTLRYSRADFAAQLATLLLTLLAGVETGIASGVVLSLVLHLWRTSRPHAAIVGQVPGTEHFRNIDRHSVVTVPNVLSIRIDESLYFPNARFLEDLVNAGVAENNTLRHVVLMCSAVNAIDSSALESLETISHRLSAAGIQLHLSEVKGPVMDKLQRTEFLHHLTGRVFLTQYDALAALAPAQTAATRAALRCETLRAAKV